MKRFNLFDAAIAVFVVVLIPIAYGTYLLFRAPQTMITSVTRVDIGKEERRVGGPNLVAKMKVKGAGFRPLLRATIDGTPAIGFVFENPNSADLLVGALPPGSHDLILFDGVQEVARAKKVVQPIPVQTMTVVVRFDSPREVTSLIKVDDRDLPGDESAATVTAIGKDSVTLRLGAQTVADQLQYRSREVKPGAEFVMTTINYTVKGTVLTADLAAKP